MARYPAFLSRPTRWKHHRFSPESVMLSLQYSTDFSRCGVVPDCNFWYVLYITILARRPWNLSELSGFSALISVMLEKMGVFINGGTPQSAILMGPSLKNHPFLGTPILGNPFSQNHQRKCHSTPFSTSRNRSWTRTRSLPGHQVETMDSDPRSERKGYPLVN